jgi:hypothetical protein
VTAGPHLTSVASCTLQLFTRPTHTHPANHLYLLLFSSFPCCVGVYNDRDGFFRVSVYNTVGLRLLYHDCPYKYPECCSTHKLISQSVTLYTANRDEMAAPIKVRGWTYFRFPPNGPLIFACTSRSIRTEIVWGGLVKFPFRNIIQTWSFKNYLPDVMGRLAGSDG